MSSATCHMPKQDEQLEQPKPLGNVKLIVASPHSKQIELLPTPTTRRAAPWTMTSFQMTQEFL